MTDEQHNLSNDDNNRHITVNAQYIKDLSFENPHSPNSLIPKKAKPNVDVGVDLRAQKIKDHLYEVTIGLSAKADVEGEVLFIAELAYSGLFTLQAIPEQEIEPIIFVYCPNLLFPFARRVLADVTRDGGFPPIVLDPIDFLSLYQKRKSRESASPEDGDNDKKKAIH